MCHKACLQGILNMARYFQLGDNTVYALLDLTCDGNLMAWLTMWLKLHGFKSCLSTRKNAKCGG